MSRRRLDVPMFRRETTKLGRDVTTSLRESVHPAEDSRYAACGSTLATGMPRARRAVHLTCLGTHLCGSATSFTPLKAHADRFAKQLVEPRSGERAPRFVCATPRPAFVESRGRVNRVAVAEVVSRAGSQKSLDAFVESRCAFRLVTSRPRAARASRRCTDSRFRPQIRRSGVPFLIGPRRCMELVTSDQPVINMQSVSPSDEAGARQI